MKKILMTALAALALCSCGNERDLPLFIEDDTIRLEVSGATVFKYEPNTCQLAFNREKALFRVHTDNMSDYFIADLDQVPSEVDQELTATLSWTTGSNVTTRKNIALKTVMIEGDKLWLWSGSGGQFALVIRVLD